MIKPASLWGLMKTCDDSVWLGDICRALGGQSVDLDFGQRRMVAVIKLDSGWMDERVEAQRERWREKKRGQRETKGDKGEMSPVPECPPPSVHPSIRPSVRPESEDSSVRAQRAHTHRNEVPDRNTAVAAASATMGVPKWYAGWWWDNMDGSGWTKTNGEAVDGNNWRAVLRAWWNRADEKEKARVQADLRAQEAAKAAQERVYGEGEWCLCLERCARCTGRSCTAGAKVPPQRREPPVPPEECCNFEERRG